MMYVNNYLFLAQKDACGLTPSTGPACCTNEVFDSYGLSLGNDLKALFDIELDQLKQLLTISNKQIDRKYLKHSFCFCKIS